MKHAFIIQGPPPTVGFSTKGPDPTSTDSSNVGAEEPGSGPGDSTRNEASSEKTLWFWVTLAAVVVVVVPATVLMAVICRRRQGRRRNKADVNQFPMRPLLPRGAITN